ncbi:MAG TPA: N-6 DNA methylase, partial [Candidatus Saccharimonadia bacterium]|nr:N-6 DNA methylase [Candidatus Saccharimonadia bacterium]
RSPFSRYGDGVAAPSHAARLAASRASPGVSSSSFPTQESLFPSTIPAGRRDPASAGAVVNPLPAPLGFADRVADDNAPADAGVDGSRPAGRDEQQTMETPMESASTIIPFDIASGQKGKARDILAAIRTLKQIEQEHRPATAEERQTLARFGGFGAVALHLFPKPGAEPGKEYKDHGWRALGEALQALLTPEEYASARRSTSKAYYTSPIVMRAMHEALHRLGVPADATVLEPGCGIGNFMSLAPEAMRFIGIEQDSVSGRMAKALHPEADIRIENFRDTRLPIDRIDAVIGNVPFADKIRYEHGGSAFALHDYFLLKSLDGMKPGGVMAVITSHYTLDKQHPEIRERLAEQADFLGAIRLPSDTFHRQGTDVVTDILFLKKRAPGQEPAHADPDWLQTAPVPIETVDIPINLYFQHHPEMVLGTWGREGRLYPGDYSVIAHGDLAEHLQEAIGRLPEGVFSAQAHAADAPQHAPAVLPPLERHITEGSFFVGDDKIIMQVQAGEAVPVTHGEMPLKADNTMMGKRLAALIGIRDQARRVLQSQNEGRPEQQRDQSRKELNRAYDRFVSQYGPVNKTTISTKDDGTAIRRMPNLVKFRDDPDAMLVMALEEYDEATGTAKKADIMSKDVVGRSPPVTSVRSAEDGLLVSLNHCGKVDLPYIASLYSGSPRQIIDELGDLIYQDPETGVWQTADEYLSGNVRAKLTAAEAAGAAYTRNA